MAEFLPPSVAYLLGNIEDYKVKMGEAVKISEETDGKLAAAGEFGKKAFLGVAVAVGGAAIEALKLSTVFDATMARINTQDGVGLTIKQMQDLKSSVLDLGGPTAQVPEALADAMVHVEGSGLRGAKALDLLKTSAEGATIGNANLVDTTNALDAAVAVGIKGTGDYTQAMGELNATVGAGDMTMQNLADALGGPMLATVKGYGLNITDVGAGLAVFGDRNIRGAEAATELRMAVQALAVPAATGADALAKIGLRTDSLRKDMQEGGLNQALNDLNDHLLQAGYNSTTAGSLITQAFGKKAGGGLNILMDSLSSSTSNFNEKFADVAKSGETFADDWAQTQDTLSFKMKSLGASAEALGVRFGESLTPAIGRVTDAVQNKALPALERFGQHIGQLLDSQAAAAVGHALVDVWAHVSQAFGNVERSVANLAAALGPTVGLIGTGFVVALRGAGVVLSAVSSVLESLTGFLRDNSGVIETLAEVILPILIIRLTYLKVLASIDMFTNMVNGIGRAAAAFVAFTKSVASGQIFDEIRLRSMYAADAVRGLAVAETEAGAAAEASAGSRGFGAAITGLGKSLPVIGAVIGGAALLGNYLGHLAGVGDHTSLSIEGVTNDILDLSKGSEAATAHLQQAAVAMAMASKANGGDTVQGMKDLDSSLAQLVSSGHAEQATAAFTQMQAKLSDFGYSIGFQNEHLFPAYEKALADAAIQARLSGDTVASASADFGPLLTGALSGARQAAEDLNAQLSAMDETYQTLSGHLSEQGVLDTFQKDLLQVKDAVNQNGTSFDGMTMKGIANREAFRSALQQIIAYRDETVKNGTVIPAEADKTAAAQIAALQRTWVQAGVNTKTMQDYTATLDMIPPNIATTVTLQTFGLAQVLQGLQQVINLEHSIGQHTSGGRSAIPTMAVGGEVTGPGTTTSDSILRRLSNREWVISAAGAARFPRQFLEAVNRGDVAGARGTLGADLAAPPPPAGGPGGGSAMAGGGGDVAVTVYVQTPGQAAWKEARQTRTEVLRYQGRNSRNGLQLNGIAG